MYQDLDFDKYKNNLPYPMKRDFARFTIVSKTGFVVASEEPLQAAIDALVNYADGKIKTNEVVGNKLLEKKCKDMNLFFEESLDETGYREAQRVYGEESIRLNGLFYDDAMDSVGLKNHPRAGKIYAYAYEKGHSAGLEEVYNTLLGMVDMFTD